MEMSPGCDERWAGERRLTRLAIIFTQACALTSGCVRADRAEHAVGPALVVDADERHATGTAVEPGTRPTVTAGEHGNGNPEPFARIAPASAMVQAFSFAPDSFDVAFTTNKATNAVAGRLYLQFADGRGDLTSAYDVLPRPADNSPYFLDVSANGPAATYAVSVSDRRTPDAEHRDVWLISADGSRVRNATQGLFAIATYDWVPDGSALLVITTAGELALIDADTLASRTLPSQVLGGPSGQVHAIAWSPDSATVALGQWSDSPALLGRVDLVDLASGRSVAVVSDLAGPPVLTYSADGAHLYAFVADAVSTRLLRIAAAPASRPIPLISWPNLPDVFGVSDAVAGPGGTLLYYIAAGALWAIGTNGANRRSVAGNADERVNGALDIQTVGGDTRLAFTVSRYLGAGHAPATVTTVQSVRVEGR